MLDRRTFLAATAAAAGAMTATSGAAATGEIPKRQLGRTGEMVSCIGLGGAHIGRVPTPPPARASSTAAIDRGITFMDNSWDYNDGDSEKSGWARRSLKAATAIACS